MRRLPLSLFFLLATVSVYAQSGPVPSSPGTPAPSGFFNRWLARTSATQAKQPAWAVPVITTYTGLIQVARTDFLRQITPARTNTWNLDNSKGLNLVPWANTELAVDLPPFIKHNLPAPASSKDGFGDFSFLAKYRIATGNAQHGSYTLSAWALTTVPTGSYKNGSANSSVQPNLGGGKGFGNFDVQSTIGATLPTGNPAITSSGRPVLWNAVAQYRIGKLFWPEIESNATFYKGGANDSKTQEFITPGIIIGKCALHPSDPKSRPGLAFGAAMQIATSQFHAYNHELALTARWVF
ncbi:MAG: hypothetical protein ABR898_02975 [Terracidiphilus sp.]|jgi:hypothetical protein